MTIDEKIKHLRELEYKSNVLACVPYANDFEKNARNMNKQAADEYKELADWLEELKELRKQKWINVKDRLPNQED